MTVDRTELRRLLQAYWRPTDAWRIKDFVADLLDELDAKDRRITELEHIEAAYEKLRDELGGANASLLVADRRIAELEERPTHCPGCDFNHP